MGKDANVEEIQKELELELPDAHIFINNKMSQLQDDDKVGDVYEWGDVLTGVGVRHDLSRSKDSRPQGDILVMVDRNHRIIFLPIVAGGPKVFKFGASEFCPSIGVFRKGEDLYTGQQYEIPQVNFRPGKIRNTK